MARSITQRELRNQSGEIMRALDRGEEFTITRNGVAVGRLLPIERRQFVPIAELKTLFAGAGPIDFERLRADLDAVADPAPHEPR